MIILLGGGGLLTAAEYRAYIIILEDSFSTWLFVDCPD